MPPLSAFFLICYSKYQKEDYCQEYKQDQSCQFSCFGNGGEAYNEPGENTAAFAEYSRMMDFKYYLIKKSNITAPRLELNTQKSFSVCFI